MRELALALVCAATLAVSISFAALARRYRTLPIGSRVLMALIVAWQVATLAIIIAMGFAGALVSVLLLELVAAAVGVGCAVSNAWLISGISEAGELEASRVRARALEEQAVLQRSSLVQTGAELEAAQQDRARYAEAFTRIADALQAGDTTAAREGLVHTEEVLPRFGGRLCAHPVVDALLKAKMVQARERGAQLTVHAEVPADIGITDAELCAIISNLVDNALAAASTVTVRMRVAQGYLVLAVQNSCSPEQAAAVGRLKARHLPFRPRRARNAEVVAGEATPLPEHGWGLSIVQDLAERREGSFTIDQQDGVLRADVVLKLD